MKIKGRKGAKRAKIGVILTLKMAKNGPKIPNISMEKGVKVPILMFLCQTYVILIRDCVQTSHHEIAQKRANQSHILSKKEQFESNRCANGCANIARISHIFSNNLLF